MTTEQKIALIKIVIADHNRLNSEWEKAAAVFGTHDNPLFEATWKMFDNYVKSIEAQIEDNFNQLHWFIYDNLCGKRALSVKPGSGAKTRKIKTIAQLVAVIEWND